MATELDTFLASIRGATADVTGVTDRMKAMEKEQALKQAYASAPEMIRAGQNFEAAGLLAQAGDPIALRDLFQQQAKAKAETAAPINPALLQQFGVDPGLLEGLSPEQQLSTAKALGSQSIQRENVALGRRAQGRLEEDRAGKPKDWFDSVSKIKKEFRERDQSIKNVQGSYELGKVAGDSVLFNYVARNIAGEKGPLSEGDVARIISETIGTTQNKVLNYFKNKDTSVFTPEQRQTMKDLIDLSVKNYDSYKNETVMSTLNSVTNLPSLYKDGKLDPRAEKYFKDFGYDLKVGADGFARPEKVVSTKREVIDANAKSTVSGPGGGQETEVTKIVEQIKDPTQKAQAQAAIQAFKGKPIPEALVQKIRAAAGGQ